MNCEDFDRAWARLLDREEPATPEALAADRSDHLAWCPRCRDLQRGYERLLRAIETLPNPSLVGSGPIPRQSPRTVSAGGDRPCSPRRHRAIRYVTAACLAMVWLAANQLSVRRPPASSAARGPIGDLGRVYSEATLATLDLAREVYLPASRVGHDLIRLGSRSEPTPADAPATIDPDSRPGLLGDGEKLRAGLEPIAGSARHAFAFLLGPPSLSPSGRDRPVLEDAL